MQRKINLKAVAIILAVVALLGTGAYFLRGWQLRRNAGVLLEMADKARDEKEFRKEFSYVQAYMGLAPNDHETRARLALCCNQIARTPRDRELAYRLTEQAIRRLPEREDLRKQAVALAESLHNYKDALFHLAALSEQAGGKDAKILHTLGDYEAALSHWEKATAWYEKATQADPKQIKSVEALARLLRDRIPGGKARADKAIQAMMDANPGNPEAFAARAAYLREKSNLTEAERKALQLAMRTLASDKGTVPAGILLLSATFEMEAGDLDRAREILLRGRKMHSGEMRFTQDLARLELRAGRKKEALEALRSIADKLPTLSSDFIATVELMIEVGELGDARKLIGKIPAGERTAPLIDYLNGRVAFAEEGWARSAQLLDRAVKGSWLPPELLHTVYLWSSRAHKALGNPDRELEAIREALKQNASSASAALAAGDALLAMGRLEEAAAEFEKVQSRFAEARIAAVSIRTTLMLRRTPETRDWKSLQTQFAGVPENRRDSTRYALAAARLAYASGEQAAARKLLEAACEKHPKESDLWIMLASTTHQGKKENEAATLAVLDRAEKAAGNRLEFLLARARLVRGGSDRKEYDALMARAEKMVEGSGTDSLAGLRTLARFRLSAGENTEAARLYARITARNPDDLAAWRTLFNMYSEGDAVQLARATDKLEELEGEYGATWRLGRAILLLRSEEAADRAKAMGFLKEAVNRRPTWGRPHLYAARLHELEGDRDGAIERYKAALDRGEVIPAVVARLVNLLSARGSDEIPAILARYRELIPRSPDLARASAASHLREIADESEATRQALLVLDEKSKDPGVQLMRGQVLWVAKKLPEAEKAFRRAIELDPKMPAARLALIEFIKRGLGKSPDAEIKAARAAMPEKAALIAEGAFWESAKEWEKADAAFKAALKERPDDPVVLRAVASYRLRRGQPAQAEPLLETLIKQSAGKPREAVWARRALALAIGTTGDYAQYKKALALIGENTKGKTTSPEDLRARALLQARHPRDRRDAIRDLEESFLRMRPSAGEEFFLATLQVANGDWPSAKRRLARLVDSRDGQSPVILAYFLEQLALHGEAREAGPYLKRLEAAEPGTLRAIGIKARLLKAEAKEAEAQAKLARNEEARSKLREGARAKETEARELLVGGRGKIKDGRQVFGYARIMEALGFTDDAEQAYRDAARLLADTGPAPQFQLLLFLGRRGKVEEALGLCEKLREKVRAVTIGEAAVSVLRDGKPTPEQCKRVAGWMAEAKKKEPMETGYDLILANIDDLQGDLKGAMEAYRLVLARDPKSILAQNNLAALLAFSGETAEALERIEKALSAAGPQPELLDTKGIVLLARKEYREAAAVLEEATQMSPDPASLARLALARHESGNTRQAKEALKKAEAGGFKLESLHPRERAAFQKARMAMETSREG